MNPFQIRLVDPLGSSGPIPLAGNRMLWQREVDRCIITIALIYRYPGPAPCTSLIQLSIPESVVSAELRKPGQGFAWGQQWSPSAGPAQGVGSGRDKNDPCPPLLEKTGKHIVKQCRGLPLSVVVVAGLLGKMDPTHDNWKKVEENLNSFFGTVSERCQSILSLSYNYLPQYLKACFLYVGGFPEDREIDVSKLIKLWIAEQFVKARKDKRLEVVAEEYLQELIDRSLILTGKQRANGRMRTCKIHDLLRQLCLSEAHTENVVHFMNGNVLEAIDDQRRVILQSKYKEKYDYRPRHSSGIVRTFIAMGVGFPKEMCFIISEIKLIKVLDALLIKTDLSRVIPELVHLRYVAANIEEGLSLAKLRNLQTVILRRLTVLNKLEQQVDIWKMSEIRHLDIRWPLYISNPVEAGQPLILNNLQTLYLYNSPFVTEIIRRTPNLKKLKIVDDSGHPDWTVILDSLSLLQDLETLHIRTMKWMIFCGDNFPPNLKQLKLACTNIPWEDVKLLANLPNLEVLKGDCAFDGTYWKLDEDIVFHKLKYLRLYESYDLKRWEAGNANFPVLEQLILHWFIQLEEIPRSIGDIMTLKLIQIECCSSGIETSAKKIQEEQQSLGNYELQLQISPMDEEREGYLKEAGDDYNTASHYILPHLLNFCDKKPLWNRETVKVPLVGRMIEVSCRASMLLTHALMEFGKDPSM
ncbi:hypothetical protein KY290_007251 [Solanum tuberosum]|uniref:Disease resistance protein winged helix domain-containing protein n=1 Tax=Solanum tuberosum TaxID=4113 RepID=A0ABQ7W541_SOLTU|nr:hypothetical protein KY290_007251 [Solanum tuberosum]